MNNTAKEWEVFESCNRYLVVTKIQGKFIASCLDKNDAIAICDAHNALEAKSEVNKTNEAKCNKCGKIVKDYSILCSNCGFELIKESIQEKLIAETDFIFIRNRLMNIIDKINEVIRNEKHR